MRPRCAVREYGVEVGERGRELDLSEFENGSDLA